MTAAQKKALKESTGLTLTFGPTVMRQTVVPKDRCAPSADFNLPSVAECIVLQVAC